MQPHVAVAIVLKFADVVDVLIHAGSTDVLICADALGKTFADAVTEIFVAVTVAVGMIAGQDACSIAIIKKNTNVTLK